MAENLLPEHHSDIFVDLINDIVQQLKENPDRLPLLPYCPLDSPITSRKPRDRERDPLAESQNRVSVPGFHSTENISITVVSGF